MSDFINQGSALGNDSPIDIPKEGSGSGNHFGDTNTNTRPDPKALYVSDGLSLREIAARFQELAGYSLRTLARRSAREQWPELRQQHLTSRRLTVVQATAHGPAPPACPRPPPPRPAALHDGAAPRLGQVVPPGAMPNGHKSPGAEGVPDAGAIARWLLDPVAFATEALGILPWPRQEEILRAVREHPRVAVRSGHKVSKSNSAAILALWWISCKPDSRVVITAASKRQVGAIVWRELGKLYNRARYTLGGDLNASPETGLKFGDGREVVGFTTDQPERIAGWSGPSLLFIVDEASGVDEAIYEAIEGNRAGGDAHLVLFGNPTQTSGTFYEAFTNASANWHTLHISSEEAATFQTNVRRVPGLASSQWIAEKRAEWFPGARWDVRVCGNFPRSGDDSVINLDLVDAALARWASMSDEGTLTIGLDVARFGDDETVIQVVRGKKALVPMVLNSLDGPNIAGHVLDMVRQLRRGGERPTVNVDVVGYGASVYDCLARFDEVRAVAVNVGQAASKAQGGQPDCALLRDELWFGLQQWLRDGGALPPDGKLQAELVAARYGFMSNGAVRVEAKEKIKQRLKRSPDRADALALAVYAPRRPLVGQFHGDWMSR